MRAMERCCVLYQHNGKPDNSLEQTDPREREDDVGEMATATHGCRSNKCLVLKKTSSVSEDAADHDQAVECLLCLGITRMCVVDIFD